MQLILNTDANIGITKKMSVIEQESLSLDEKFSTDEIENDIPTVAEHTSTETNSDHSEDAIEIKKNGNKHIENARLNHIHNENSNTVTDAESNKCDNGEQKDVVLNKEICTSSTLKDEVDVIHLEDAIDKHKQIVCGEIELVEDKSNYDDIIKRTDSVKPEVSTSNHSVPQLVRVKTDVECETNEGFSIEANKKRSKVADREVVDFEFTMRVKNVCEINENSIEKTPNDNSMIDHVHVFDIKTNSSAGKRIQSESSDENSSKTFEKGETKKIDLMKDNSYCEKDNDVIDIADERDEECVAIIDQQTRNGEKDSYNTINTEDSSLENIITNFNDDSDSKENTNDDIRLNEVESNIVLENEEVDNRSIKEIISKESLPTTNTVTDKKTLLHISKLSNTLDILSDDEEAESKVQESEEKQCINIEDDEDIMLIDEETPNDECKKEVSAFSESDTHQNDVAEQSVDNGKEMSIDVDKSDKDFTKDHKPEEEEIATDLKEEKLCESLGEDAPAPLVPVTFLKSYKKNLAEMTREELEEFCVLRIVESIVDRSNLSEMNQQLKSMSQIIEDFRKKTQTLMKQNRDLQVVLKSIQEEQKKNPGQPITPLKITRSVGMQVLMIEATTLRKKPASGSKLPNNIPNSTKNKSPNSKIPKGLTNTTQQIPVPRLVPAGNNNGTNKAQTPTPTSPKVQGTVPNGLRISPPAVKPEKRSFGKMQQGNSVTVDLTDDEPPSKMAPRNVVAPVRLVPQQSLLTTQKPQFINAMNSPRKVYIPISGSQTQVRPGQTIMLKQCPPQAGPRLRGPAIISKPPNAVRLPRIASKHPAPLPDDRKQYQPPNWKALPPAPELKLSKVENGIVISWKIDGYQEENHEEIASYQLYAYQETTSPPNTALWKKIGDVKALPLPMACTLTQFMAGYKYYFAVRAVDVRSRLGPFSLPGSILLLNKM